MESKGFSVGNALKVGWWEMKKHWLFFISFEIVMGFFAVLAAFSMIHYPIFSAHPALTWLVLLILFVIESILVLGLFKSTLHAIRGETLDFRALYSQTKNVVSYIISHILFNIIVALPFIILLFIPTGLFVMMHVSPTFVGVWSTVAMVVASVISAILAIKYAFYAYVIVDKSVGPIQALKESGEVTHGSKWDVLFLYIGVSIVIYLGIFAMGVGILFAIPLALLAMAEVYNRLMVH